MYKKIKNLINTFHQYNAKIIRQNEELIKQNDTLTELTKETEWANIYHDTIRDKAWLSNVAISPGRWAGNYSLFYLLVRILTDYKPNKIVEFGLGESSKIISAFLDNLLTETTHLIIEQDSVWARAFESRFAISNRSAIKESPLMIKVIEGHSVNSYSGIEEVAGEKFDLYIIDGPFGSSHYSRFDICAFAENLSSDDEFIIVMDDYDRTGEQETIEYLQQLLLAKKIETYTGIYGGNGKQFVIATAKYRFATSL